MSDNIVHLKTPTGGRASIAVQRTQSGGIELRFERHLGQPDNPSIKSESVVGMSAAHARFVARQILEALGEPT